MDDNEKEILESLKNFDTKKLFLENTYFQVPYNNLVRLGYIVESNDEGYFASYIQEIKGAGNVPIHMMNFLGETDYTDFFKQRNNVINKKLFHCRTEELIELVIEKIQLFNINIPNLQTDNIKKSSNKEVIKDKNGKIIDIKGYYLFQFLQGELMDYLSIVKDELSQLHMSQDIEELLALILDIIIYVGNIVIKNLNKYKNAFYNRKLMISSNIHAYLLSFDSLLVCIQQLYIYGFGKCKEIEKRIFEVANLVYKIIMNSKSSKDIPWPTLIVLLKFVSSSKVNRNIEHFDKKEIYSILTSYIKQLKDNELKFNKNNREIRAIIEYIITSLYEKELKSLVDNAYEHYLITCLKCKSLEKKMNALNDFNDIIAELDQEKSQSKIKSFKKLIEENKILELFFEDSIHDELLKRAGNIFKFMAKISLNDEIIEKLIEKSHDNELMKKILIDLISELPNDKKDILFQRLTKDLKLEKTEDMEYLSELSGSCIKNSTQSTQSESGDNDDTQNYNGLNIIFDYIIKNFNDKVSYEKNNIDSSIECFERVISKIMNMNNYNMDIIFHYVDQLLENIKSNPKHNSIIQSIKLIQKLFDIVRSKKNFNKKLKKLDEKYDIINLLIDDLCRYLKLVSEKSKDEKKDSKIFEGIYPHDINIEQRLKMVFYFFRKNFNNLGLTLKNKKYLDKIYQIFKSDIYKNERKKLYENLTLNLNEIENDILLEFFNDILQNKDEFNLKEINDNETINFITQIFIKVNENKNAIWFDGRNIRIEGDVQTEGFDMLFDLLTQNPNKIVQNKISQLLSDVCLSIKNYNNPIIKKYWITYFKKISQCLDNISKIHDQVAFDGVIKLINKIYSFCCNCQGKIPTVNDYKKTEEGYKVYKFSTSTSKREYNLRAGYEDKLIELRWKLGYYFDIPVNNVTFIDLEGKKYNLNNDFDKFCKIFSDERYFSKKGNTPIKIENRPFKLSEIKDNPKSLIEKDEKIYNILIDNLKKGSPKSEEDIVRRQKIWNIISKFPKDYYFNEKLKKYGEEKEVSKDELNEIFDRKNIYILTHNLQCFYNFLFKKEKSTKKTDEETVKMKEDYLNNFIVVHKCDEIILDLFLNKKISPKDCKHIEIECLSLIVNLIKGIEDYKLNKNDKKYKNISEQKDVHDKILKKSNEIISNLLELDIEILHNYLKKGEDDTTNLKTGDGENENNKTDNIEEMIKELAELIFEFLQEISEDKKSYMEYLIINDDKIFKEIFIYKFIKCENSKLNDAIDNYLNKGYHNNIEYIKKYLEIIFTKDVFNYIVENDKTGKYFHIISSIMNKYYDFNLEEKKKDKKIKEYKKEEEKQVEKEEKKDEKNVEKKDNKQIEQSKEIIDIILKYIEKECEEKEINYENMSSKEIKSLVKDKENFKEGIISFLINILKLNSKELVKYIVKKVDICKILLNNCILRKCVKEPLNEKNPFCVTSQTKEVLFKLLIFILHNSDNEDIYINITKNLNELHQIGFWKLYSVPNWDLQSRDLIKEKYVGLKNMTATCYLNSIIQQLFMIPMFRESILKFQNIPKSTVLYELQLLFSALKLYEFPFYDPCSFVIMNKASFYEQMDADEYYGNLIDKIENDIKNSKNVKKIDKVDEKNEKNDIKIPEKENKYKNILDYFFGIRVSDELKFAGCGHKRSNEFFYNSIQLEIKQFNNVYDSLKNYCKTEIMDGDNKINCEECKIKRT